MPLKAKIDIQRDSTKLLGLPESSVTDIVTALDTPVTKLIDDVKAVHALPTTSFPVTVGSNVFDTKDSYVQHLLDEFFKNEIKFIVSSDYKDELQNDGNYTVYVEVNGSKKVFHKKPQYDSFNTNPTGTYGGKFADLIDAINAKDGTNTLSLYLAGIEIKDEIQQELDELQAGLKVDADLQYELLLNKIKNELDKPGSLLDPKSLEEEIRNMIFRLRGLLTAKDGSGNFLLTPDEKTEYTNKIQELQLLLNQTLKRGEVDKILNEIDEFKDDVSLRYQYDIDAFSDNFPFEDKIDSITEYVKFIDEYLDTPDDLTSSQKRELNIYKKQLLNLKEFLELYQSVVEDSNELELWKKRKAGIWKEWKDPATGKEYTKKQKNEKVNELKERVRVNKGKINNLRSKISIFVQTEFRHAPASQFHDKTEKEKKKEEREAERAAEKEEREEEAKRRREERDKRNTERVDESLIKNGELTSEGEKLLEKFLDKKYKNKEELDKDFACCIPFTRMNSLCTSYDDRCGKVSTQTCLQDIGRLQYQEKLYTMKYVEIQCDLDKSSAEQQKDILCADYELGQEFDGSMKDLRKLDRKLVTMKKKYKKMDRFARKKLLKHFYDYYKYRYSYNYRRTLLTQGMNQLKGTTQTAMLMGSYCPSRMPDHAMMMANGNCQFNQVIPMMAGRGGSTQGEILSMIHDFSSYGTGNPWAPPSANVEESRKTQQVADGTFSMETVDGGKNTAEYEYENPTLITEFISYLQQKDLERLPDYDTGYVSLAKEIGLRHMTGRNNFDFYTSMRQSGKVSYSQKKLDQLLEQCVMATVDQGMISSMKMQFKGYKNMVPEGSAQEYEMMSLFYMKGLSKLYPGYEGITDTEAFRAKIMGKTKGLFGSQRYKFGANTKGNVGFGYAINTYATTSKPKGLGLQKGWMRKRMSVKETFFHENGGFKGLVPALESTIRGVAAELGMHPKHIGTVVAATKIGLAAYGATLGFQLMGKIRSGDSMGVKLQRLLVAGVAGATIPPALFDRDLIELFQYTVTKGDPTNKGLLNTQVGSLLNKMGADIDLFKDDPETVKYSRYSHRVFEHLKMPQLREYIRPTNTPLGKRDRYMSYNDYMNFIEKYGHSDEDKREGITRPGKNDHAVAFLKSLYNHHNGNMYAVSADLGRGLEMSGLHDEHFDEFTSGAYAKFSFSEFQAHHRFVQKHKERLTKALGGSSRLNDYFKKYMDMSTAEQLQLESKLDYIEEMRRQFEHRLPYIRYNFLHYRNKPTSYKTGGTVHTVDLLSEYGLNTAQADQIATLLDDQSGFDELVYEFIAGDISVTSGGSVINSNNPDKTLRNSTFNIAFANKITDPTASGFVDRYMLKKDSPTEGLDGFFAVDAGTPSKMGSINKVRNDARQNWIVGQLEASGTRAYPDPPAGEIVLTNVPGIANHDIMVGVDQKTNQFYIWGKRSGESERSRYDMTKFMDKGAKVYSAAYSKQVSVTAPPFMMQIETDGPDNIVRKYSFKMNYDLFTRMVKAVVVGDGEFRITQKELKAVAVFDAGDPANAFNNTLRESVAAFGADKILGGLKIKFEKNQEKTRPEQGAGGN